MSEWKPTGQQRFRVELRRWGKPPLLVLQLQERGLVTWWLGGFADSGWENRWRDASVEDMPITLRNDTTVSQETQASPIT